MKSAGTFYGVGAGPGDPELLTVKAVRVLKEARVLVVPRSKDTSSGGSQALGIIKKAVDTADKEILEIPFPMTKDKGALEKSRREAAFKVVEKLKEGKDAAFITLGDPMLYSTFSYLIPLVREMLPGADIRVVPGITSFSAAASLANIPIAEADEKVLVIPAAYDLRELEDALRRFDTVILMKVNKAIDGIIDLLASLGLDKNAFLVSRAGWPDEEVITDIKRLKGTMPDYFSIAIVKKKSR